MTPPQSSLRDLLQLFCVTVLYGAYCPFHTVQTVLSFTFGEARGLSCVRQAELVFLPAAVVADQRVIGLLDVHVVANAEHITGGLQT